MFPFIKYDIKVYLQKNIDMSMHIYILSLELCCWHWIAEETAAGIGNGN